MTSIFIWCFLFFWLCFAFICEYREQKNAYISAIPKENDTIYASLRKLRYLMTYEVRVIKWRRSLLAAFISTILIYLIVWNKIPNTRELILHIILLTSVYSYTWDTFSSRTAKEASSLADKNINKIKKNIS